LDGAGIAISAAVGNQARPMVAVGGGSFFVAWEDFRTNVTWDVYGARVAPSGAVLDASGLALVSDPSDDRLPALAFGGSQFLLAYERSSAGPPDVHALRVDTNGQPAGAPFPVIATTAEEGRPAVASDDTDFLVGWSCYTTYSCPPRAIRASRRVASCWTLGAFSRATPNPPTRTLLSEAVGTCSPMPTKGKSRRGSFRSLGRTRPSTRR
ncbi:MAG: hypothetical protein ACOZIN_19045, partial [Myxococcota bacterium]